MKSILSIIFSFIILAVFSVTNIYALTPAKWYSINTDSVYYTGQSTTCSTPVMSLLSQNPNSLNSTWSSTASPPYSIENFVINVLQDVATKLNLPSSDTVTQQHVLALVAWAYLEGGNIHNTFWFNPWNTSYSQPNLLAAVQSPGGFPTYASFNAGVEAAAISMTGSYQTRIGTVLANPSSNATDVLNAVAYPLPNYPSNLGWDTSSPPAVYGSKLLQVLSQAENSYSQYASIVIGPGQQDTNHVSTSSLAYNYGSLGSTQTVTNPTPNALVTSNPCSTAINCQTNSSGASSVNSAILCEAQRYNGIYYSWGGGHGSYATFRQNCPETAISSAAASSTSANPGPCGTDCSGLVTVAIDAAFNQNYSMSVSDTTGLMVGDGAQYWQPISLNQVQPGDIATWHGVLNGTADGHVEIVDHYDSASNTLYTFGSHSTGSKTSEINSTNYFMAYYRWTGPTS